MRFAKMIVSAIALCLIFNESSEHSAGSPPSPKLKRMALLVGCNEYQLPQLGELWGSANDIPIWKKTLIERFSFLESAITVLAGWPDKPEQRPTCANIKNAVHEMIARAGQGDEIVIVLSGHGCQIPAVKSAENPPGIDADGVEEVFLAADAASWTSSGVENGILDVEISDWLNQFEQKGAHVWIVFDCCHATGLAKHDESETTVPAIRGSLREPKSSPDQGDSTGRPVATMRKSGWLKRRLKMDSTEFAGSVVAFYACQGSEVTPDVPRPPDAPRVKENYYGLFSYSLLATLSQHKGRLTYHELFREVEDRYRRERPGRPPHISQDGLVVRPVLGLTVWPKPPDFILTRGEDDCLTLDAGELAGLTQNSILSVSAKSASGDNHVLGYVRVINLLPTTAAVKPVQFRGSPEIEERMFQSSDRCRIVSR